MLYSKEPLYMKKENMVNMYNVLLKKDVRNGMFELYVANKLPTEKEKKA